MTPIIIDILASGQDREAYPIEVGLVLADGTRHCHLVAPARSWRQWDPASEKAHGLSRALLEAHGRPVGDIAWRLNALLGDRTVYCLHAGLVTAWLDRLFAAAHSERTFGVAALSGLLAPQQQAQWDAVRREVREALALPRRRASGNAWIVQEAWKRLNARKAA
ncbi:hypothetical protein [endosymbiont of unidentified scaly snail isolate Monju]|uniref:hypothetical protein n=1 Tax=endosymbiont of unidentified scaly snail isolate Monju TaxID=1248727 RepID=UPI0003891B4F|nr:hypothetical protein [endosymbiont of unidentified scaly snail isolate Monju]BAN68122.1 conserved hypothetical protein [endosymbiont of unidentified scaly snail isolate Monju]